MILQEGVRTLVPVSGSALGFLANDKTFISKHPPSDKVHSVSDILCPFSQFCVCYTFKHLLTEYTRVAVARSIMAEIAFVSRCPLSVKKKEFKPVGEIWVLIAFASNNFSAMSGRILSQSTVVDCLVLLGWPWSTLRQGQMCSCIYLKWWGDFRQMLKTVTTLTQYI